MNRLFHISVALLVLLVQPNQGNALELTQEECVALALANNSGIKSFEMSLVSAGESVRISRADLLPSLKLMGRYALQDKPDRLLINSNSFAQGIPPQDVDISTGNHDLYDFSLTIRQPLFTGGNLTHSRQKSESQNEEARFDLERQRRILSLDVKRTYNEVLNDQLQLRIVETLVQAKQERLRVLRERFAEGYVEQEDILAQGADVLFAETELSRWGNRTAYALSRLKQLMQLPVGDELVLKGKPFNGTLTISLQEAEQAGIANREDVKSSWARIRTFENEVGIARSGYYPQASLLGSYLRQKETNIARPDLWTVMVQLEWQLFEWGRTDAAVTKADAVRQGAVYVHEELKKKVMLETEQAWREVRDWEKSIKAHEKRLQMIEFRMGRVLERYKEGEVMLADALDVEAALIKANNDYVMALNDLGTALAQFEAAVATPVTQWLVSEGIYRPNIEEHIARLLHSIGARQGDVPAAKPEGSDKGNSKPRIVDPESKAVPLPADHDDAHGLFSAQGDSGQREDTETARTAGVDDSALVEEGLYRDVRDESANKEDSYLLAELSAANDHR